MLEIRDLSKTYSSKRRKKTVINNISLSFPNYGIVGIVGESGVGKTTLINILSGMDRDYSGQVLIDDVDCSTLSDYELHSKIGYLKQNEKLIPYLTVKENLEYFYRINNLDEILQRYHINVTLDKYPTEISGGEQQRLAILQAVLEKKKILLLDEPTSSLDDKNAITIMEMIQMISKDVLIILICHDENIIEKYCNKVIEIKDGTILKERIIIPIQIHESLVPSTKLINKKHILFKASTNFLHKHKSLMFLFAFVQIILFFVLSTFSSFLNYNAVDDISSHINQNYYGMVYQNYISSYSGNDYVYEQTVNQFGKQNVVKTVTESFLVDESSSYQYDNLNYTCILDQELKMNEIKLGTNIYTAISGKTSLDGNNKITINKADNGPVSANKYVKELISENIIYVSYQDYFSSSLNHFKLEYIEQNRNKSLTIYKDSDYSLIKNKPILFSTRNIAKLNFESPTDESPFSKYNYIDLKSYFSTGLEIEVQMPNSIFKEESLIVPDSLFVDLLNKNKNYNSIYLKVDDKFKAAKYYSDNNLSFSSFSYLDNATIEKDMNLTQQLNSYIGQKDSIKEYKYLSYIFFAILGTIEIIILVILSTKIDYIKKEENNRLIRYGIKKYELYFTNIFLQIVLLISYYLLSLLFIATLKIPLSMLFQSKESYNTNTLLISFFNNFILEICIFTLILISVISIKYLFKKEKNND
ncbi:MAG: ATP-binding cassette domain-containing protein [Bacilli bacterium]